MLQHAQRFLLFLLPGLLFSCHNKKSTTKATIAIQISGDDNLYKQKTDSVYVARDIKVYNDVLNDLIKNHFYFYYLGSNYNKLYEGYNGLNAEDTVIFNKRQKEMTNNLLANPNQLCTLYINLSQDSRSRKFDLGLGENEKFGEKINAILNKIDGSVSEKLKYLSERQQLFNEKSFHSPLAKISAIYDRPRSPIIGLDWMRRDGKNCTIGIVALSNIILNKDKKRGVVYYEFLCGSRCARGELAEIEKVRGKWQVVNTLLFWIS